MAKSCNVYCSHCDGYGSRLSCDDNEPNRDACYHCSTTGYCDCPECSLVGVDLSEESLNTLEFDAMKVPSDYVKLALIEEVRRLRILIGKGEVLCEKGSGK